MKLEDGSWINNKSDIQSYFEENFKTLYRTSDPQVPRDLENLIALCISKEENRELCRIPSREEIRKVVLGMKSLKAPSPDGFPTLFYKHYWDIVGDQVVLATQSFFFEMASY